MTPPLVPSGAHPGVIAILGAVLVGVLTASQSRVNSELALQLGDGYLAAVISFGSGLVILLAALLFWAPGRRGVANLGASVRGRRTPWWYLCGGLAGALFVLSQGLTGSLLGVAMFTIAVVCGQTLSGLVVDRIGMGSVAAVRVTVSRLLGSLLTLVAVGWAVSSQVRDDTNPWIFVLPLVAGMGIAWQQAANGQVRVVAKSALTATLMNFVAGTIALSIAAAVHLAVVGAPDTMPTAPWLYLGGLLGTLFIGLGVIVVKHTGVLLLGLGAIAGQLIMSLALDAIAPVSGRGVEWTTVLGTALTLGAVVIAAIPSRAIRGL
ncbi:MAG: DMT family transporter [Burkholderiaceae bacterium]|nr:DMT family transporter [Microbacteriaceae bacterium]